MLDRQRTMQDWKTCVPNQFSSCLYRRPRLKPLSKQNSDCLRLSPAPTLVVIIDTKSWWQVFYVRSIGTRHHHVGGGICLPCFSSPTRCTSLVYGASVMQFLAVRLFNSFVWISEFRWRERVSTKLYLSFECHCEMVVAATLLINWSTIVRLYLRVKTNAITGTQLILYGDKEHD